MLLETKDYKSIVVFIVETKDTEHFAMLKHVIYCQYKHNFIPVVYKKSQIHQIFKMAEQNVPMYTTTLTVNKFLTALKVPNKLITALTSVSNLH